MNQDDLNDLGAQTALDEVKALLGQKPVNSLEEMQAVVSTFMAQRNARPIDDFQGLAAEEMHSFLHLPFDSPNLASFPKILATAPTAPILSLFNLLADALANGLKPTAKGNLPRKVCRDIALAFWGEEGYHHETRFGGINKEEDFFPLHVTRVVAELAGLVRKHKGKFILSGKARKLMEGSGDAGVYPELFKTYVETFNWAYWSRWEEPRIIQRSFLFTLYLLHRFGDKERSTEFYEDCFLRAFPAVLQEVTATDYMSAESIVRLSYRFRALKRFAEFLGLAKLESSEKQPYDTEYRIIKMPLLEEVVQFHELHSA